MRYLLNSFLLIFFLFSTDILAKNIDTTTKIEKKQSSNIKKIVDSENNSSTLLVRSGGSSGGRGFGSAGGYSSSGAGTYGATAGSSSGGYSSSGAGGGGYRASTGATTTMGKTLIIVGAVIIVLVFVILPYRKNTTIKLQFAFHAIAFQFVDDIKHLVTELDLDEEEGRKKLLDGVIDLLIRNKDYIRYANVEQSEQTRSPKKAEQIFDKVIKTEKDKFTQETFQKHGNRTVKRSELTEENKPKFLEIKEYIIFSLILCHTKKKFSLVDDYGWEAYKNILEDIFKIPAENNVAVEILWSPDAEDDVLTEDDITTEYPNLKSV